MISMYHTRCTINTVSALGLDPGVKLIGTQCRLVDSEENACRNVNSETHCIILAITIFIWDLLETSAWNGYSVETVKVSRFICLKVGRISDDPQCDPLNTAHIISLGNFLMKPIIGLKKNRYLSKTANLYLKTSADGIFITSLHKLLSVNNHHGQQRAGFPYPSEICSVI